MKIISTKRASLFAAGASLVILAAAAPAAAQESYWDGWYLGVNAGASWGDNKLSREIQRGNGSTVIPPADIALINSGVVDENNKTGFTGGIEGGYNWVGNNWLIGIEADAVALSSNSRESRTFTSPITHPIIPPPRRAPTASRT